MIEPHRHIETLGLHRILCEYFYVPIILCGSKEKIIYKH